MPEHAPARTVPSALDGESILGVELGVDLGADEGAEPGTATQARRRDGAAPPAPPAGAAAPLPSTKRSLAYVYAGHLLRIAYLLVLVPYYGRVLGPEEYGRVLTGMSIYMVVWLIAEGGMPPAGLRNVQGGRDLEQLAREFGRQLSGRLWACLAAAGFGAAAVLASPMLRERPVLGLLAIAAGLVMAFNLGWLFTATLRFRTMVAIEVLGFVINLVLVFSLVQGPTDGAWVFAVLLTSGLVCTAWAHALARRAWQAAPWRLAGGLRLLRETLPLFATRSLSVLMTQATTYLLALSASADQVGQFGAAERIVTAGLALLQPAQQVFVGTISYRLADAQGARQAHRLMWHSLRVHAALGLGLGLGTWLVAPLLVPLLLGPGFEGSIALLRTMALLMPLTALTGYIGSSVLMPLHEDATNTLAAFVGVLVLVLGIVWLAPLLGASGAALVRVAAQAAIALLLLAVLLRHPVLRHILRHGR